ncbi:hypothetical protein PV797_09315 [Clostridiaceae bacterium M8S5]|nr:hypothetical protein PV797_09315 [Clostridiaceae bacterium M8S5]
MGERSKKSGEYGEKIIRNLLNKIGWNTNLNGIDIKCLKPEKHKHINSKSDRTSHGLDFLFQYACPLIDQMQQNIVISVKNRAEYPKTSNGVTSKFKEFLKDISFALECFPYDSRSRHRVGNRIKSFEHVGVIFWLAYDEESSKGIIEDLQYFKNTDDLAYKTVYLVDNKRIKFLIDVIDFANQLDSNSKVEFYYPDTGFNIQNISSIKSGMILPVQYINSSIIPFKITDENNSQSLLLCINDNFSEDNLRRLIGLGQALTQKWQHRLILAFPNYKEMDDKETVSIVQSEFSDSDFAKRISVKSFNKGIRTLEEE